jgi:hypothetical protein
MSRAAVPRRVRALLIDADAIKITKVYVPVHLARRDLADEDDPMTRECHDVSKESVFELLRSESYEIESMTPVADGRCVEVLVPMWSCAAAHKDKFNFAGKRLQQGRGLVLLRASVIEDDVVYNTFVDLDDDTLAFVYKNLEIYP